MSSTDERVVSMKFDNTGFEAGATKAIDILEKLEKALKFDNGTSGIESVKKAVSGFDMDNVSDSVEECSSRFGAFEAFVTGIFLNLGNRAANFGINMAKNLTVKPLMDGFGEYETQIRSVQTILSNAGEKLKEQGFTTQDQQIEKINQTLDELNTYADKTIYNFSEMTRNIGTFTAAGVDLDTAVTSIKGIANLAAASGSTSQQASTAMYQLSQAIASGTVKLQDWNSVVNAGMGGELFQEALKRTARNHGIAVDAMIEKNGSFRESLQEGWITSYILTETLSQLTMSYEEVGDEAYNANLEILKNQGYSDDDAKAILDLAKNAEEAATKVRTWSQLWETVGEALGSGWATTWRTIVGDFLEATDLFTHLSNGITGIISASADARNAVLADWAAAGGRTALVDGIKYIFDAITSVVETFGQAFSDVFGISAEQLFNISAAFASFAEKLVPSQEAVQFLYDLLYNVFTVVHSVLGVFGNFIRIVAGVASVVWKLVSPFVKLAAILVGGVVKGLAFVSSLILKITDYVEAFIGFGLSKISAFIDYIYGGISKLSGPFGSVLDAIKVLIGVVPSLARAFVNLITQSEPFKFIVDSFKSFGDYAKSKLIGVFDKLKTAFFGANKQRNNYAKSWEKLTPFQKAATVFESVASKVKNFATGFIEASDKVGYLRDAVSSVVDRIKNKFKSLFSFISSPALIGSAISNMVTNLKSKVVGLIDKVFGEDVSQRLASGVSAFFDPIADFFGMSLQRFETWGEAISKVIEGIKKIFGKGQIGVIFRSLFGYFSDLAKSGKSVPDMVATVFLDVVEAVKYGATHIPELLSKAAQLTKNEIDNLIKNASEFKDKFVEKFREAISKMPSPEEIGKAIGSFITAVRDFFSKKFSELFSGDSDFAIDGSFIVNMIRSAIENVGKLISGIKVSLPENFLSDIFSSIGTSLSEAFGSLFDGIKLDNAEDAINTLLDKVSTFFDKNGRLIALVPIFDFIHSLSSMNRGIGKFGKTFGKNFRKFGKSIGDGLSDFGKGFTSFKKQTKAQAFMRIAAGMLILAAALWVLSKIPSDRLIEVAKVLGILAVGIAALSLVVGGIAKLTDMDLDAVGKSIAGFGIGILALAAAVWIFSKIPGDKVEDSMNHVLTLIAGLTLALVDISLVGADLKGAAATLVAMAAAIVLLMIPIQILGRTPDDVLTKGGNAVGMIAGVLTGAISIMELANIHKSSILGAAPTLLALAISITLLMIPIEILGRTPDDVLHQGGNAVGLIAGVLSAAIGLIGLVGKHSMSILAATPALLALTLSIGLAIIPIKILGNTDSEELKRGGNAVGQIAGVLSLAIALIGAVASHAVGILAGSVGLIALSVAVGLIALIVAGLSKIAAQNPAALEESVNSIIKIIGILVLGLAGIGAVGVGAGTGLAAIAGGITLLGLSFMVLAGGIMLLQNGPNWEAISSGINSVVTSIQQFASDIGTKAKEAVDNFTSNIRRMKDDAIEAGRNAIQGLLNGIGEKIGELGTKAQEVASSFINSVKSFFGIASPSTVMAGIGGNIVQGLINGIGDFLGSLGAKAQELGSTILNGVAGLPGTLMTKGSEAVGGFIAGVGNVAGGAIEKGSELASGFVNGARNLYTDLKNKASNGVTGFVQGASSKIRDVSSKSKEISTKMVNGLSNLKTNLKRKATEGVSAFVQGINGKLGSVKSAASNISSSASKGLGSLYSKFKSAGSNAGSGFVDGIGSMISSAASKAAQLAKAAIDAAKRNLKINSPSKVFRSIGASTGEGFIQGIDRGTASVAKASASLAGNVIDSFSEALSMATMSGDDLLDIDDPVITPVLDTSDIDYSMDRLRTSMGMGFNDLSIGNLNYTGELSAKISDYNDLNKQTLDAIANNQLDYNLLGAAVANALIRSGVHVEIDGGQLMGYLAGEISDARRMYG